MSTERLRALLLPAAAPVLWGAALVAGRVVSADLPPITITWIRFVLVSLVLLPMLKFREGRLPRPRRGETVALLLLAITGVVLFNLFLFSGLQTVTAVRSSVILALSPSVVALALMVLFGERAGWNAALGIAVAFVGVIVTITDGRPALVLAGGVSIGDLYLLGSVLSWSAYTIIARYAIRNLSSQAVLSYSSIMGAVLLTPIALRGDIVAELAAAPPVVWAALLYLIVGAAGIGYFMYYEGIREVGPNRAAVFLNLEPISAILLGVVLLGEGLSTPVLLGAGLVICGLYLVNRPAGRNAKGRNAKGRNAKGRNANPSEAL
ncbi:MAG: DMT family transporter [Spirochaetaceae bacterium]